jgi:MoaA/NifB/PqqE/SkfB family radical SAM enzyme
MSGSNGNTLADVRVDPRRYHESVKGERTEVAVHPPVCVYLEVTNRCNLLCTTCPRTYEELEPPADMSWDLFRSIVDQLPDLARAVLHGVGEPMLVADLPRMVRYLKDRGVFVLFNTNGTVLSERNGRALIAAGLDELRVSLDASNRESFKAVRGRDYFNRIVRNVRAFCELQKREGHTKPQVSAWLTGLRETVKDLPAFVKLAADIGVREVYLQRLVFFDKSTIGKAQPDQALFEQLTREEAGYLEQAEDLARALGITFSASGAASEPGLSLKRIDNGSPWSLCRRPWSLMYFTANGRALPCCIAPFSQHGYETTRWETRPSKLCGTSGMHQPIGNSATPYCPTNRPPPAPIAACAGACEHRHAREQRSTGHRAATGGNLGRHSCLDEEAAIARVVTSVLAQDVREVVVVDGGSRDRTVSEATGAGARVIVEPQHGYGRAIQAGIAAVRKDAEILVFLDGDGSDSAEFIPDLVLPIIEGTGRLRSRLARSWVA